MISSCHYLPHLFVFVTFYSIKYKHYRIISQSDRETSAELLLVVIDLDLLYCLESFLISFRRRYSFRKSGKATITLSGVAFSFKVDVEMLLAFFIFFFFKFRFLLAFRVLCRFITPSYMLNQLSETRKILISGSIRHFEAMIMVLSSYIGLHCYVPIDVKFLETPFQVWYLMNSKGSVFCL